MNDIRPDLIYVDGPNASGFLTVAIALTQYSELPDADAGRRRPSRTPIGVVLNDAKYRPLGHHSKEDAQAKLSGMLIAIATDNEYLRGATAVIPVPGTDHDFSELLAADVAQGLDLPVVSARRRSRGGHPAKWRGANRQYEVADRLGGPVLIIDDFYRSGRSMRGVAQAALQTGATSCRGLVVAYTPS